jgi:hypothetical protein
LPELEVTTQPSSKSDFSNALTKVSIERLAEADEHEVVMEVQVSFATRIRKSSP